jgi:hypothetical protein
VTRRHHPSPMGTSRIRAWHVAYQPVRPDRINFRLSRAGVAGDAGGVGGESSTDDAVSPREIATIARIILHRTAENRPSALAQRALVRVEHARLVVSLSTRHAIRGKRQARIGHTGRPSIRADSNRRHWLTLAYHQLRTFAPGIVVRHRDVRARLDDAAASAGMS